MTGLEDFIFKNFKNMPTTVRIIVYLLFVIVFIYLLLCPRFVDGKLYFIDNKGRNQPYRGATIEYFVEGRLLKVKVTEEGYWSIPIVSLIPRNMKITIINLDTQSRMNVQLDIAGIWREKFGHPFSLRVDGEKVFIVEESGRWGSIIHHLAHAMKRFLAPTPLYAQELELPLQIQSIPVDSASEEQVRRDVVHIISEVAQIPTNELTSDFNLKTSVELNALKRIIIVEDLQNLYDIDIPDEHWIRLESIRQITDYIIARIRMQKYFETLNSPSKGTYRQMIHTLPKNEQPKFVP